MIYFIGGPPRVGKSIIAEAITRRHGVSAVSTDSLGEALEAVLDPETEPGLFAISRFNEMPEADRIRLMAENPSERIDYQIEESTAVWRAVEPFVRREQEEGRDLVAEGVAVLPELVAVLPLEHVALHVLVAVPRVLVVALPGRVALLELVALHVHVAAVLQF